MTYQISRAPGMFSCFFFKKYVGILGSPKSQELVKQLRAKSASAAEVVFCRLGGDSKASKVVGRLLTWQQPVPRSRSRWKNGGNHRKTWGTWERSWENDDFMGMWNMGFLAIVFMDIFYKLWRMLANCLFLREYPFSWAYKSVHSWYVGPYGHDRGDSRQSIFTYLVNLVVRRERFGAFGVSIFPHIPYSTGSRLELLIVSKPSDRLWDWVSIFFLLEMSGNRAIVEMNGIP